MGSTPERVSPEHPLPAMGSAGLGKLLGLFCKERVEDGCGGLLDEGDRPSLKRERSGKWKGRSAAEGCTSEARKPGETPCGRERGRAPLAAFAPVVASGEPTGTGGSGQESGCATQGVNLEWFPRKDASTISYESPAFLVDSGA
jgi:hypothetical protein